MTRLAFPPRCAGCDADLRLADAAYSLCAACRARIAPSAILRCVRCGAAAGRQTPDAIGCDDCRGRKLGFDRVWVFGDYVGEIRAAVLRMKHAADEPLTAAVGRCMAEVFGESLRAWRADVVTCVPMHWTRRWATGTNSAEILAEAVARRIDAPLVVGLVSRRRRTELQAGLPPTERINNVRGAFRLTSANGFPGAKVLLVDDVLTTGATCGEIARLMKRAGADQVAVACVARTPRGG